MVLYVIVYRFSPCRAKTIHKELKIATKRKVLRRIILQATKVAFVMIAEGFRPTAAHNDVAGHTTVCLI